MSALGDTKPIRWDDEGYEHRERLVALADCPKCGRTVECWAETEHWTEGEPGRFEHSGYGGAIGVCDECEILIADCLSEGFMAISLPR